MNAKTQTIEIDSDTATVLQTRAAEGGVSVSQIVAELVPLAIDNETIAELDRRWAEVEAGGSTMARDEVERWLRTWGTPDFRPWRER